MSDSAELSNLSDLHAEYLEMRRVLYKNLFKCITMVCFIATFVEISRAVLNFQFGNVIGFVILITVVAFLMKFISGLKKNPELIITIFFTVLIVSCFVIHYYGNTGYFDNVFDSFYFAYTMALFDRLIVSRIPKSSHRIIYSLVVTFLRLLIIPTKDNGMLVAQFVTLIASVYFDLDKEVHDQNLFKSYFYSREELLKFKNLVVHDIPEGIVIVNSNLTKLLFVNNSFRDLFKIDFDSTVQDRLKKFNLQKGSGDLSIDSPRTLLEYLLDFEPNVDKNPHNLRNIEFRKGNNGENTHLFEAKILELIWDEQEAFAIIFHDITQQETIFNLKAANENKDAILATISHELRTPLNGMLGMIQIMQKQITDKEINRCLDICKSNGHLLLSLVNSILDLNQIRANKLKMYPDRINLLEFLKDITALFEFQCAQKGIFLKLNTKSCSQQFIVTDRNRLSQILINLIGNALKFTMQGGITVSVRDSKLKEYIKFSIEDTGCGIKEQDKGKLFQMFGKLNQENKGINKQGVGLGLTISNDLAKFLCCNKNMEGIKVESEYNKGSIFSFLINKNLQICMRNSEAELLTSKLNNSISLVYFEDLETKLESYATLPLKKPPDFQSLSTRITSLSNVQPAVNHSLSLLSAGQAFMDFKAANFPLRNSVSDIIPCVLIVDDNPFNITVAGHLVARQGYKAKTALYGQVAINIVLENDHKKEPIVLILMDLQMPLMDGYETTRQLRKLMKEKKIPEIPIISLSANDTETDIDTCRKAGMCGHLSKPLKENELIRILQKYDNSGLIS